MMEDKKDNKDNNNDKIIIMILIILRIRIIKKDKYNFDKYIIKFN